MDSLISQQGQFGPKGRADRPSTLVGSRFGMVGLSLVSRGLLSGRAELGCWTVVAIGRSGGSDDDPDGLDDGFVYRDCFCL